MNIKDFANNAKLYLSQNSSTILTGLSIGGVGLTIYNAVQDSRKADYICAKHNPKSKREEFELTWKCYIPTAISAATTVGCIIGSKIASDHQKEAISSAYLISQATLQKYQEKVIEQIGVNKAAKIHDDVIEEVSRDQRNVLYSDGGMAGHVIDTGHGNQLFYDMPSKTYFKSDTNYIMAQVNKLNHEVRTEMWFDQNEILYRFGLSGLKYGHEMIFDVDHPLDPSYVPEMMENGQVLINIDYELIPKSLYSER